VSGIYGQTEHVGSADIHHSLGFHRRILELGQGNLIDLSPNISTMRFWLIMVPSRGEASLRYESLAVMSIFA
jgi:hypothetical protein